MSSGRKATQASARSSKSCTRTAHTFIYELLQNAEDAGATEASFVLNVRIA